MRRNDAEHQHVPLPPRDLPVPCPRDDHHRLGEEHEREREGEHEPLVPAAVETKEAEGGEPVERDADRRQEQLPAVELLGGERIVERRKLGERDDRPAPTTMPRATTSSAGCRSRSDHVGLLAPSSSDDAAANTPASTRPTGVASSKPAFGPRSTPGVASAWRPRKAALATKASEIRSSRASRRRRAAVVTLKPSAVATSAAPSTSQKCAGWFSQSLVDRRSREQHHEEHERCSGDGDPGAGTHRVVQVSTSACLSSRRDEGRPPRLVRARAARWRNRSRGGARDRAEARRAGGARTRRRDDPRPAAPARRRRARPVPDDARHARSRRALRAPALLRAPARGGGHAPPSRE